VRCIFKHAFEAGMIPTPVRFGPGFKRPSKKTLRLHRAKQGPRLFTAEEIHRLIGAAAVQVKAMILLGINCGFGNSDCGHLPLSAVDLDKGIIDFPRPKTGIPRRCVLWPETVEAIRAALAGRVAPKKAEHAGLIFVTRCGDAWYKDTPDGPLSRRKRPPGGRRRDERLALRAREMTEDQVRRVVEAARNKHNHHPAEAPPSALEPGKDIRL
jgi:integrase